MTLVTVCPKCSSKFVVGQDQLAAQQGRLRCGHCDHVFNGLHHLYQTTPVTKTVPADNLEVPENATPLTTPESSDPYTLASAPGIDSPESGTATPELDIHDDLTALDEGTLPVDIDAGTQASTGADQPVNTELLEEEVIPWPLLSADSAHDATQSESDAPTTLHDDIQSPVETTENLADVEVRVAPDDLSHANTDAISTPDPEVQADAQSDSVPGGHISAIDDSAVDTPLPDELNSDRPEPALAPYTTAGLQPDSARATLADQVPSNLNDLHASPQLERRPRKRLPVWAWSILLVILLLGTLAQTLYFMRTHIATVWPATKPALGQACQWLGCKVELPAIADLLAIDDSDLKEDTERTGLIHLTSTVINNAPFAQAYPRLELTLTDVNDKPILRRTFQPGEYLPAGTNPKLGIPAGDEIHVHLRLNASGAPVVGYRVFVKYD